MPKTETGGALYGAMCCRGKILNRIRSACRDFVHRVGDQGGVRFCQELVVPERHPWCYANSGGFCEEARNLAEDVAEIIVHNVDVCACCPATTLLLCFHAAVLPC